MRIHRHRRRSNKPKIPHFKANERIQSPEVRVVHPERGDLGVMKLKDALAIATSEERDLVEVAPQAKPPVCKVLDFGQFKYQKEKEARKRKAQSKEVEVKAVRLSVRIGDHDLGVRLKQAKKFLDKGDKVKAELPLRGREKAHRDVARGVVEKFLTRIKEDYEIRVEQPIEYRHGRFSVIVAKA
jgi:translation initiation factor IF-3